MKNEQNAEHFYTCGNCGGDVDMRDLGEVFHHEGDCLVKDAPEPLDFNYTSKKVGDNKEYLNGKTEIGLN